MIHEHLEEMFADYLKGLTIREIAEKYGYTYTETLAEMHKSKGKMPYPHARDEISNEFAEVVHAEYITGEITQQKLAEKYLLTSNTIGKILRDPRRYDPDLYKKIRAKQLSERRKKMAEYGKAGAKKSESRELPEDIARRKEILDKAYQECAAAGIRWDLGRISEAIEKAEKREE